tara:strand:- start:12255 stop:12845 length:591 start_codon:yes stop_codon:yes gene_type:complete
MNVHTVDGKKVIVVDDAFGEDVKRKWIDYYIHKPFFNNGVVDSNFKDGQQSVNFNSNFPVGDYMNVFPMDYVLSIMKEIHPDVSPKYFYRSYINAIKSHMNNAGHQDYDGATPEQFYIVALWFANPYWDSREGGSISFGEDMELTIQNWWNRLIVFDATLFHHIQPHHSHLTRLSTYTAFTNTESGMLDIQGLNKW